MSKVIKLSIALLSLLLIYFFLSFRIMDAPSGLTADEAAFGYNGVLLSRTLHDQNYRFLPLFVLTIDGTDWKQPITSYYIALFFKLFGASVLNLRLSTVFITLLCTVLMFILGKMLMGQIGGIITALFFLTTPIVLIQTHLALDNIMVVPFTCFWLISMLLFEKRKSRKYLVFAALSLGIGFYSYKGMRVTAPVWCVLTVAYLYFYKKFFRNALIFSVTVLPFFLIIPYLLKRYPGAIIEKQGINIPDVYSFFMPYLSSFDPTFLYITGDTTIYHSTGKHGMMLLATIPFFVAGLYQAIKKQKFYVLLVLAFFTAPFLYGFVNSIHRASRLMTLVPPYSLLCTLGVFFLWQNRKKIFRTKLIVVLVFILIAFNYSDFLNYYLYTYPKVNESILGTMKEYKSYQALSEQSKKLNLKPLIAKNLYAGDGEQGHFYEAVYFPDPPLKWNDSLDYIPQKTLMLSNREKIPNLIRVEYPDIFFYLQRNP